MRTRQQSQQYPKTGRPISIRHSRLIDRNVIENVLSGRSHHRPRPLLGGRTPEGREGSERADPLRVGVAAGRQESRECDDVDSVAYGSRAALKGSVARKRP